MRKLWILSLGLAALALPARAKEPGETVTVTAPALTQKPADATVQMHGDDDMSGHYVVVWPRRAYQRRDSGNATLRCLSDAHGLAESCEIASETPEGHGFGKAALELRPTFKLTPAQGPNGPIASTMTVSIDFKAPDIQLFSGGGRRVIGNPLQMRDVTMLDHPVWVQAANFDDVAASYPATGGGSEGYAVAHCKVETDGALGRCQIIKELPEKAGFGAAALALTEKFRILPALANAPTHDPIWVDLPIRFPAPGRPADRTINAPIWLVKFDPANAPKVFPPEATAQGLTTGLGVARCTVGADGALTDCSPEAGEPDGLGFSEAAVTLASVMKMNLWSADAAPVEGGTIHLRMRLTLQ